MRARPAQEKALVHLRTAIRQLSDAGQKRLPTVHVLAEEAGVSPLTMLRAVRRLRDQGVVTVSHGRGIRLAEPNPPFPAEPREARPRLSRWAEVRAHIEADIVAGRYSRGAVLPAPKQLRHELGVSHRTLKRALDGLVESGILVPFRRTYRIASIARPASSRDRVLLAAPLEQSGAMHFPNSRSQELFLAIERECSRRNLAVSLVDVGQPDMVRRMRREPSRILGSIVWALGLGQDAVRQFLAPLAVLGPSAALMEVVYPERRQVVASFRQAHLFSIANSPLSGRTVGTFLRALGHRSIVYIAPIFKDSWTRNRLQGLRETFEGDGRRVVAVTRDRLAEDDTPEGIRGRYRQAMDTLQAFTGGPTATPCLGPLHEALQQSPSILFHAYSQQFLYATLTPLFEEALTHADATAWVAHNDVVGLKAMEFLRERGISVPRDISVVGFDNRPEASAAGLTSYDHNGSGLVRAMLDCILGGPLWSRTHRSRGDIEVPGSVIERASTGAPRRSGGTKR